jgi:hypothetical protein
MKDLVASGAAAAQQVKDLAVATSGCGTFAELAALSLARHFVRKGRRLDARRLLRAYLDQHGPTPRITAAWALTA